MSLHFEEENSWKEEHKRNIVNHYITNNSHPSITDQHQICKHLINKAKEGASSIKDYRDKHNS